MKNNDNPIFETTSFDDAMNFVKALLNNNYQVKIRTDCEGVYMIDYIYTSEFTDDHFARVEYDYNTITNEDIILVDGERVFYASEEEDEDLK